MKTRNPPGNRIRATVGLLSLGLMVGLLSLGVNAVRAGDGAEKLMSVDPLLVSGQAESARAAVVIPPGEVEEMIERGSERMEVMPDVVVLNTRGYNYGPPPAIDPAAMNRDSQTP
jgi:hypothetical protein